MQCPVCESTSIEPMAKLADRFFQPANKCFCLYQCKRCNNRVLLPKPSPDFLPETHRAGSLVEHTYSPNVLHGRLITAYRRAMLYTHVQFVRRIAMEQQKSKRLVRLLDVGCGDGSFLDAAEIRPCIGMDISPRAVAAVNARGVSAVNASLRHPPFPDHSFSLVTLFHVLEHLSPPQLYLERVRQLLSPNGDVVIQVPNFDCAQAKLLKGNWLGYDAPRHVVNYSATSLIQALVQSGFTIIRKTSFSLRDNAPMLASSIVPRLYPPARETRRPLDSITKSWIADLTYFGITLVCLPITMLESIVGHGATIMVHARKA